MSKLYQYVGPRGLYASVSERHRVQRTQDVQEWIVKTRQQLDSGTVVATFVVDAAGQLWIADRHSEHVACAAGQPVLSAGEITFSVENRQVSVAEASNQSLGYCPEPSSWPAVAAALDKSALRHPPYFTSAYIIRLCEVCRSKNIIKDDIYECGVCQSPLPTMWNFSPPNRL